jgi:transcriptional regulator
MEERAARAAIAAAGVGLVVTATDGELDAVPVPLLLDGDRLIGHVARGNPLWRRPGPVLVAFTPATGYVSPSWYPSKAEDPRVVPTWNYVTVLVHGRLTASDDPAVKRRVVEDLTVEHERRVGSDWRVDDAPEDFVDQMLGAIVGIEVTIDRVEGKAKLSQNRSASDVSAVASSTPDRPLREAMGHRFVAEP